ncbi:primosomal protein N' [Candidatus Peregrinibacteria bacterium]|nr:primosomal protein N' [Candidatus Peregrinibacteria bacterium]
MFAKIIIFKKAGQFDDPLIYGVPLPMEPEIRRGKSVVAPLGLRKIKGMVVGLVRELPPDRDPAKIRELISFCEEGDIPEHFVLLAERLSGYYRTSMTHALRLMVPAAVWKSKAEKKTGKKKETTYEAPEYSIFPLELTRKKLTADQETALRQIRDSGKPVLLHGVTGSGKTEVYLHLILDAVRAGKQAILLVPEIALTPQMVDYFKEYFGGHIALFHSRMTETKRAAEWRKAGSGYAPLIIGSRSAVFAPVPDPGLMIIDEEHEWTYKQESAPYYETAHVAEMLIRLTGAKFVMGSATPRIESLQKTRTGEYLYLGLPERVNKKAMPGISVIDLRDEFKQKNFSVFSRRLQNKIKEKLAAKEQVILFVNQRGFARAVTCRDCGYTETCPHCEVALKLHGGRPAGQKLLCHYCGFTKEPPLLCPNCRSPYIRHVGVGTERVEEEAKRLFPEARTIRADSDTTGNKEGFEPIYRKFKEGQYDILIGTQMVAKGLDFPRVSLIGIILADIGLHIPDFRSHERLFQLITQVSGRCGRAERQGEVVLQTYQPEHFAIQKASVYDYGAFAENELKFRRELQYPPFGRIIKFTVVGSDAEKLKKHIEVEKEILEDIFRANGLDFKIVSAPALIPRLSGRYYYHVLLRAENPHLIFNHWKPPKGWRIDVDPVHTV